jgi:hypothetical protein
MKRSLLWILFLLFETNSVLNFKKEKKIRSKLRKVLDCFKICYEKCVKSEGFLEKEACNNKCKGFCKDGVKVRPNTSQRMLLNEVKKLPNNFCTTKDPCKMSKKEALIAFAKGPCSPIIVASGTLGSRLTLEINCEVFKAANPSVFESCGWTHCNKLFFEFWKKVPDSEYDLWPPQIGSPLSFIPSNVERNKCLIGMVTPKFDFSKPLAEMAKPIDGITVRSFGFSPKSKDKTCGKSALQNILPILTTRLSKNMEALFDSLERIGYVSGVSYQALPYNFFFSSRTNEFNKSLRGAVEWLYNNVGKKVVVATHSTSNISFLQNVSLFSFEERKKYFHHWVAIGPTFLGVNKSTKNLVAADDDVYVAGGIIGINFRSNLQFNSNMLGLFDHSEIDFFTIHAGEAWLDEVKKRMAYQNDPVNVPFENSGFSFLPKVTDVCNEVTDQKKDPHCKFELLDTSTIDTIKVLDKSYKISEIKDLLNDYNPFPATPQIYDKVFNPRLMDTNPMIPTSLIFMNSLQTPLRNEFNVDLKEYYDKNYFPKPVKKVTVLGDRTAQTYSAIVPGLKWAYEFDNKTPDGFEQPVKFVEWCGVGFTNKNIYDKKSPDSPSEVLKNDYVQWECECNFKRNKDYADCYHSIMNSDEYFILRLHELLNSNSVASAEHLQKLQNMNAKEYENAIFECKHIVNNQFE